MIPLMWMVAGFGVGDAQAVGPGDATVDVSGNAVEEGPWAVTVNLGKGVPGYVFGGEYDQSGKVGSSFYEFFYRKTGLQFLGPAVTWDIAVDPWTLLSATCKYPGDCQRTQSTLTTLQGKFPEKDSKDAAASNIVRGYHAAGSYLVTATHYLGGDVTAEEPACSDYYIVPNGSSLRTELLCVPVDKAGKVTMPWPAYNKNGTATKDDDTEVRWKIEYVSAAAFTGCGPDTGLLSYSVNLAPDEPK